MVISTFSTRRWQASYIFSPFSRVVYRNTFWLARLCVYLFSRLKLLLRLWNELVGNCLYSKRVISAAVYNFHVCLPPVAIRGLAQSLEYKLFVFSFLFNSGLTFSFWDGAPSFFSTSCASSYSSWLCVVAVVVVRPFHLEQLRSHNLNPIVHLCPVFKLYGRLLLFIFPFFRLQYFCCIVCGMSDVRSKRESKRRE